MFDHWRLGLFCFFFGPFRLARISTNVLASSRPTIATLCSEKLDMTGHAWVVRCELYTTRTSFVMRHLIGGGRRVVVVVVVFVPTSFCLFYFSLSGHQHIDRFIVRIQCRFSNYADNDVVKTTFFTWSRRVAVVDRFQHQSEGPLSKSIKKKRKQDISYLVDFSFGWFFKCINLRIYHRETKQH